MKISCLLALGGNIPSAAGPPAATFRAALARLGSAKTRLIAVSRFYETPCFPAGAGPDYLNAAAAVETTLSPGEFLKVLHGIENELGRERQQRWGRRTLDLDLLAAGDSVLPDRETYEHWQGLDPALQAKAAPDQLILPHPRLGDRGFVLIPLAEIAPDWRHPVSGLRVRQMADALPADQCAEIRHHQPVFNGSSLVKGGTSD